MAISKTNSTGAPTPDEQPGFLAARDVTVRGEWAKVRRALDSLGFQSRTDFEFTKRGTVGPVSSWQLSVKRVQVADTTLHKLRFVAESSDDGAFRVVAWVLLALLIVPAVWWMSRQHSRYRKLVDTVVDEIKAVRDTIGRQGLEEVLDYDHKLRVAREPQAQLAYLLVGALYGIAIVVVGGALATSDYDAKMNDPSTVDANSLDQWDRPVHDDDTPNDNAADHRPTRPRVDADALVISQVRHELIVGDGGGYRLRIRCRLENRADRDCLEVPIRVTVMDSRGNVLGTGGTVERDIRRRAATTCEFDVLLSPPAELTVSANDLEVLVMPGTNPRWEAPP